MGCFTPRGVPEDLGQGDVHGSTVVWILSLRTLAAGDVVFQASKSGDGFLLRKDKLGGIGGEAFHGPVCSAAFGTAAYREPVAFVLKIPAAAPSLKKFVSPG